jgi:hypothetical protein
MNGLACRNPDVDSDAMSIGGSTGGSIGSDPLIRVSPDEIEVQISRVEQRLVADFSENVPPALVTQFVREAHSALADARITQFIPTLIERRARGRLLERSRFR